MPELHCKVLIHSGRLHQIKRKFCAMKKVKLCNHGKLRKGVMRK